MCSTGVCKFSRDHSTCVYFIPWEGHRASFQNPLGKATGLLFRTPLGRPQGFFSEPPWEGHRASFRNPPW